MRGGSWTLAAVLALGILLAGCLAGVEAPDGADPSASSADPTRWAADALPHGDDHDHGDRDHHRNLSTDNFEVVGYDPLITDHHGSTAGGYFCGATGSDGDRRLAVVHGWMNDVAFVVVDVTDPEDPRKIGELVMPHANVYELDIGPDMRYVALGTSVYDAGTDQNASASSPLADAYFRNACTGEVTRLPDVAANAPYYSGVVLVDLQDPTAPEILDYRPLPLLGGHSVRFQEIDEEPIIIATVWSPTRPDSYYAFLGLRETPAAGTGLELLSTYRYTGPEPPGTDPLRGMGAHDGFIREHPGTGRHLAFLAYGSLGLVVVDVEDPTDPQLVGRWDDWQQVGQGAAQVGHFSHQPLPMDVLWDGRHYTFLGEECLSPPADAPSCYVAVLDTTDPADPRYVGSWTLPEMVQWDQSLQFSIHHVAVQHRTLFVTTVHGGMWAVDVSTPEALREMPTVGVFVPDRDSPAPPEGHRSLVMDAYTQGYGPVRSSPVVGDVHAGDGTLTVFDVKSGLYEVRFDASDPATTVPPWHLRER